MASGISHSIGVALVGFRREGTQDSIIVVYALIWLQEALESLI